MLDFLFHPNSIALVGITISNPEHWTRNFLNALIEMDFKGQLFLVNRSGGEIAGRKVYHSLAEIPGKVDYVISTVPASAAPDLIKNCAVKGVKVVHLCTAGFSETGEKEGIRLETEVSRLARKTGIRIIGPNCLGIYCPKSHLSYEPGFPRENGTVGFISQSGGNTVGLIKHLTSWRGVRFSKVISIGNACDLNETDFLEYLADDPDTKIIAMYIEGIKDGTRFKKALGKATRVKPVILYKGGVTKGGSRATLGHTGSLAGDETTWNSLCRQFGVIRVNSLEELADVLVTLLFFPLPRGRNTVVIGSAGGPSVIIADQLEKNGLNVPALPQEIKAEIRSFVTVAGNSLRNPVDIGQIILEVDKVIETTNIVTRWEGTDFLTTFFHPGAFPPTVIPLFSTMIDGVHKVSTFNSKPVVYIIISSIVPEVAAHAYAYYTRMASLGMPVYYSFEGAARAIDLVLCYNKI